MLIIGESINGTIKKVGQAILDRDEAYIRQLARIQYECGAQYLDVNAGVVGGNELEDLPWVVELVQKEVPIPLMIDSANPEALESAISLYHHTEPPILNSISGEEWKMNKLFPVISKERCKVVVLCMDGQGIPKTVEKRVEIAKRLYYKLLKLNIPPEYIYFDVLALSIAVEPKAALLALETIKTIHLNFPQSHIICGISNVSMGLPGRKLINRAFLIMAIYEGLDTLLIDVRDKVLFSFIYTGKILTNQDPFCLEYIRAYREKRIIFDDCKG